MERSPPGRGIFPLVPPWAAAVLLLFGGLVPGGGASPARAAAVGNAAPPLALRTADGVEFVLPEQLRDHPVFLAFVSARCKPCEESKPALEGLSRDFGARHRVALVSVFLGPGSGPEPSSCQGTPPDTWAEATLLGDQAAALSYGVFGTPVFVLVGKDGTVLWRHVGRLDPGVADAALAAALGGQLAAAP